MNFDLGNLSIFHNPKSLFKYYYTTAIIKSVCVHKHMIYIWHLYTKLCIYDVTININLLNFTVAFYKWHTTLLFDQISQHLFKKKLFLIKNERQKNTQLKWWVLCYHVNVLYTWGQYSLKPSRPWNQNLKQKKSQNKMILEP